MADARPIRTPLRQQWRRVRYQLVPVAAFAGAVALTGMLWQRHQEIPATVGEVEAVRIPVRATVAGFLAPLDSGPLRVFDEVKVGQQLARLDDAAAQAGLLALRREADRLTEELAATEQRLRQEQAERGYDRLNEARRLAVDAERYRLAILSLKTDLQAEQVRVDRLGKRLALLEKARGTGAATTWETDDLRLRRDESSRRAAGLTAQIREAEVDLAAARRRVEGHATTQPADFAAFLAPFRQARAAQEARARELELQIASMVIRAPITGTICAILRHPGQAVQPGEDILTIASDRGRHIVAYVRQYQRLQPAVGMAVRVHARSAPGVALAAQVTRVGPQIEQVPPHQRLDPTRPEWGLPVLISIPPDVELRPGELVDIAFKAG